MTELVALAEAAVRAARAAGAAEAEGFVNEAESALVALRGPIQEAREARVVGVGVRVIVDGRLGFVGAPAESEDDAARVARRAVELARGGPRARFARFPAGASPAPPAARPLADDALERLLADARAAIAPLAAAPAVTFHEAVAIEKSERTALVNTSGVVTGSARRERTLTVELRATTVHDRGFGDRLDLESGDAAAFGARLAQDAARQHRTVALPKRKTTLVLEPAAAFFLLTYLETLLRGPLLRSGQSPFAKRDGDRVLSEAVTLLDDAPGFGVVADDEGVATARRALVDRGVFRAGLHDAASAAESGIAPPGNGFRYGARFDSVPQTASEGLSLEPGRGDVADLLREAGDGVVVHGSLVNVIQSLKPTGFFSLLAPSAYRFEKGEIVEALDPITVAGNVVEALAGEVRLAGSAVRWGARRTPAVSLPGIVCAS